MDNIVIILNVNWKVKSTLFHTANSREWCLDICIQKTLHTTYCSNSKSSMRFRTQSLYQQCDIKTLFWSLKNRSNKKMFLQRTIKEPLFLRVSHCHLRTHHTALWLNVYIRWRSIWRTYTVHSLIAHIHSEYLWEHCFVSGWFIQTKHEQGKKKSFTGLMETDSIVHAIWLPQ